MVRAKTCLIALTAVLAWSTMLAAQAPSTPERKQAPGPWRFIGAQPCVNQEGSVIGCAPPAKTIAVRAGRLFDSMSGQMLTRQVVIVTGEKIVDVGPDGQVKVPAGAQVIDLSQATVLPGLIDAHTHMFNNRTPAISAERSMLIAIQNLQADLNAGVTAARDMSSHGNGYADVDIRNAINMGDLVGPRYQVERRTTQPEVARRSAGEHRDPIRRRRACRGSRARRERGRLDQAVSDRRVFVQPDRRSAVRPDVSAAGAAGDHR